jgi:hypothetical protein
MDPPEILTDADIAKLAPKLDSTPTGTKEGAASSGKKSDANPLIIGGTQAARGDFPWQVALVVDSAWFCGGSLIDGWWVMTAAHCAKGYVYSNMFNVFTPLLVKKKKEHYL